MKKLFYLSVAAFILSVALFMCSCSAKITVDEKKAGVIVKGKKHLLYKGNLSKYSYFGHKNKRK